MSHRLENAGSISPARIPRFKLGATETLAISGPERRRGVDVDAIGMTIGEPDALVVALERQGVRRFPSVASALVDVIGVATGEHAVRRRSHFARQRSKARAMLVGWSVLATVLLAVRFAYGGDEEGVPTSTAVGLIASSLVWAALVALVISSVRPPDGGPRPIRDRFSGGMALAHIGALAALTLVPLVVAGWMASHLGTPRVFAYGLVAGLPGGALCGIVLRTTRRSVGT